MLTGQTTLATEPWLAFAPGCSSMTTLTVNLAGDRIARRQP
jgi:hypothetical protein